MSGAADRVLAPRNSTSQVGKIGVLALTAGVASSAQDLLAGGLGRFFVSIRCTTDFFVTFGDDSATVNAPNPANTGWLGAGASDGRCFGPIAAKEEWNREIGPETRYVRFYAAAAGQVTVYISSVSAQGTLPG